MADDLSLAVSETANCQKRHLKRMRTIGNFINLLISKRIRNYAGLQTGLFKLIIFMLINKLFNKIIFFFHNLNYLYAYLSNL